MPPDPRPTHPDVLDTVIAACSVPTAVLDADGRIATANAAFTRLTGIEAGAALPGVPSPDGDGVHPVPGHADGALHLRPLGDGRRLAQWPPDGGAEQRQLQMFADTVAHDLKAPLRSIDAFAKLLEDRAAAKLDATERMHLSRIRAAATRMAGLLASLGELSRAAGSAMQTTDVDLSLLAEWVLAELQDADPGRRVAIDVQPGLQVPGDERLLKQMLRTLLENAWKFTRGREPARIEVHGHVVGDRLHVEIRDTGCGFDMQYAHKLFQPFQRLHGVDQGAGHGLGLAVAQRIARRHGGDVRAHGTVDAGSTFTVELPVHAGEPG